MATRYATHKAAPVRQITKVVIGGTWATSDTLTATIGSRVLTITVGADTSTTQVATALRDAWNSNQRLDSEGNTDATSNFGGYECGEFMDGEAYIDPDEASTVYIRSTKPGIPFTTTIAKGTSASGTVTQTTPQAATGPWHWDDSANWDTPPTDADTIVLKDLTGEAIGFKFNFPASLEATLNHYMSYTGPIGLPALNTWNGKTYQEYRQRYLALDFNAGSNILHRFGMGKDGPGSPLINVVHNGTNIKAVVYNTGTPQVQGTKALNIASDDSNSDVVVYGGSVDVSSQFSTQCIWNMLTINGGDVKAFNSFSIGGGDLYVRGGTVLFGDTGDIGTCAVHGGTLRLQDFSGDIATKLLVDGGQVLLAGGGNTIASLLAYKGEINFSESWSAVTITAGELHRACRFVDPYQSVVASTDFYIYDDPSTDWIFGANPNAPIKIVL